MTTPESEIRPDKRATNRVKELARAAECSPTTAIKFMRGELKTRSTINLLERVCRERGIAYPARSPQAPAVGAI